jgi:hypothetical protein
MVLRRMRRLNKTSIPVVPTLLGGFTVFLVSGLTFLACGGSKRLAADAAWTEEHEQTTRPLRETEALAMFGAQPQEAPETEKAMVGVRPDLMIAKDVERTEQCTCLAVEVGMPGSSKFSWQNGPPSILPDALAIAISAKGIACANGPAEDQRRPSISAVDRANGDVIVEIEDLAPGRPLASGAIIPKPGPNGSVYVRPKSSKVPYGRDASGRALCKVR